MVFKTHFILYKVAYIVSYILVALSIIGAIVLMIVLKKLWWISLVSFGPAIPIFVLTAQLFDKLMGDIDELNAELSKLRSAVKNSKSSQIPASHNNNDAIYEEIVELKEELETLQTSKRYKKEEVKEEVDNEIVIETPSRDIKVEDKVKLTVSVEKNGVMLRKGKVGTVDNILRGFAGITYVVVFPKDKTEYKFDKNEIELVK